LKNIKEICRPCQPYYRLALIWTRQKIAIWKIRDKIWLGVAQD